MSEFPLLDRILALWMKRGLITSSEQLARLKAAMTDQSFFLTGEWEAKALAKIQDILGKAMDEGWPPKEFKDAAKEVLARFNDGSYADIVFRTNVSTARTVGMVEERFDPEWATVVEYWQYVADVDSHNDEDKECPDLRCRWLNGRVFRKDDARAAEFIPILHFGCRCDWYDVAEGEFTGEVTKGSDIPFSPLPGWSGTRFSSLAKLFAGGA
jgi:SPP1 gp7 family putative phage head morphogenesis protein